MKWQLYQSLSAKVTEVQTDALLVSFDGHLCRIQNRSGKKLKVGDLVQLEVIALAPLRFRLQDRSDHRHLSKSI